MGAILLDGRSLAARLRAELAIKAQAVAAERGRRAALALVIVGENASALLYGEQVQRSCTRAGVDCALLRLPGKIGEVELAERVTALGHAAAVDGVALLLPLPAHIRQRIVTEALPPEKDVDGLGPANAGRLMLGFPSFVPSTADAALELLRSSELPIRGLDAVVVGRSNVGGKPAALLFLREGATITLCHTRTPDLAAITRQADLLFVSAGQPGLVTGEMVKPGAIVLDAGLNVVEGRLVGDVDFDSAREVAGYLTPAPGGLGPLTNLMLIRHTVVGPS
ncbi:MAG TPA: bifunctional 5,10-methylenetetrahydrofolate dehydrogenase/5,10-methenyltetrahydrofolate cyclohydrolase [Ktedonobacterales bacterium]|jgi:methylenetetrahydrofolate dehydrogenase (NADP+)/methenyltetrahydrofolate cyclohydrolase